MGAQKNVPQKQKIRLLKLICLFLKWKFNETNKDFSINYPYNSNCGKKIFSFNSSLDQTMKYFGAKLIRQANDINFIRTSYIWFW